MKKRWLSWHKSLGWWTTAGLLMWCVSAVMHPLMSWFGPSAAKFYPPAMQANRIAPASIEQILSGVPQVKNASILKLVPSNHGPVLQLSQQGSAERTYVDLETAEVLPGYDEYQAKWLASYYTGLPSSSIATVEQVTRFSADYPWVNRLLPVYKVVFDAPSHLQAYIYTETGALASLSNPSKQRMQWVFQQLHTFKWLEGFEFGRVILIALFMFTLAATAVIGLVLLWSLKPRRIPSAKRRWHRRLAYVLWFPLLAWSASGFYHLIQSSQIDASTVAGVRLGEPLFEPQQVAPDVSQLSRLNHQQINALALVRGPQQRLYWRASVAVADNGKTVSKAARFRGKRREAKAVYLPAFADTQAATLTDRALARALAQGYAQVSEEDLGETTLITRFGPEYDFRNKRLPVWKVELNDAQRTWLFIDPATGVLVDRSRRIDRAERWSFSVLHKWSPLNALISRQQRDGVIVATLLTLLLMTVLGAKMLLRRR